MAGGSKIKIKGGIASKGEAVVIDGALLVTDGGSSRALERFYGEDLSANVVTVNVMGDNTAIGIPLPRAMMTVNVAVKIRHDTAAPVADWTLRLFKNDVQVATFAVEMA